MSASTQMNDDVKWVCQGDPLAQVHDGTTHSTSDHRLLSTFDV